MRDNAVIIRTDGGICSQIVFYAYGQCLEKRGFTVKYDTSWFDDCGMDIDNRFVRNYDMARAFPELHAVIATAAESKRYKEKYNQTGRLIDEITSPAYIGGYPVEREECFINNRSEFINAFHPIDADTVSDILQDIESCNACAVHVRRGDLGKYTSAYGYPATAEYFIKAIKLVQSIAPDSVFFFFSDEPEWILENIAPKLDKNTRYQIIDRNGSDKGYLDLYLISKCKNIISSQGSMGVFGYVLSNDAVRNGNLIMSNYRERYFDNFDNVLLVGYKHDMSPRTDAQPTTQKSSWLHRLLKKHRNKK